MIGTVSSVVQPDDIIVIFAGSHVPYILREQNGGKYMCLGPAYIHGIMYGEVWKSARKDMDTYVLV